MVEINWWYRLWGGHCPFREPGSGPSRTLNRSPEEQARNTLLAKVTEIIRSFLDLLHYRALKQSNSS
ncbi:MAG: hypothetical protein KDB22_21125 [Planctomycetales bacterium]|nr:hypothetical protein [Planctomycetales bacterium]